MGKEAGIALKPLHWDKMTPDSDHSMVWDNIGDGSFRLVISISFPLIFSLCQSTGQFL